MEVKHSQYLSAESTRTERPRREDFTCGPLSQGVCSWQTVAITTLTQERSMPDVREAQPLAVPDSDALRFLPEGPVPLQDGYCSWVGIQHGADSTSGSLNLLNLSTMENHCHH